MRCGIVDYCHHTELADAPAGRRVKSRLARLFRVRVCGKSWTEAKNVASPGSLGAWPKSSCGKDVRDVMGAGCKGPFCGREGPLFDDSDGLLDEI